MSSGSENSPSAVDTGDRKSSPSYARREGNDSLWKRARRTLGTQNLGFLQPTARPTGAASTGPPAPNKRREQVRQAQRTHRQRTQNYIKTLESEVVRLRDSETKLMSKCASLHEAVDLLKGTVLAHNLALPSGIGHGESPALPPTRAPYDMDAAISFSADEFNNPRLQVTWPEFNEQTAAPAYSQSQLTASQGYGDDSWSSDKPLPDLPNDFSLDTLAVSGDRAPAKQSPVVTARRIVSPDLVDTLAIAIDFVLALEHPCMAHIPYPADPEGDDPANHMMLASTPLMAAAPRNPQENPDMSWTASGNVIKQLLSLSRGINLQGEITPVEAWHILSHHPSFQQIGKKGVEILKVNLSPHVQCCGFGAVLDESVFWYYFNDLTNNLPPTV